MHSLIPSIAPHHLAATVANLTMVAAKAAKARLLTNTGGSSGVGNAFRTATIRSASLYGSLKS